MAQLAYEDFGLSKREYTRIKNLLQKEPTDLELALFGVRWSEHYSYKSSAEQLKIFNPQGRDFVFKGERNAGFIELNSDYIAVMQIKNNNDMLKADLYQGAKTAIGGIVFDLLAKGATPIALLNSFCLGELKEGQAVTQLEQSIKGSSDYANCIGLPTVNGQVSFQQSYQKNPLINMIGVGILRKKQASLLVDNNSENHEVLLVGAATGRCGIKDNNYALDQQSSAVEIGDPFMQKLLMDVSLALIEKGLIEGLQGLGRAGLAFGISEVASKFKKGMELNLEQINLQDHGMSPVEIMLSGTQERLLLIVNKEKMNNVQKIIAKYDLEVARIGQLLTEKDLIIKVRGAVQTQIPVEFLVEKSPRYNPAAKAIKKPFEEVKEPDFKDLSAEFLKLLQNPNLADKKWIYQQFDSKTGLIKVKRSAFGAALLRFSTDVTGLGVTVEQNSNYVNIDPYWGSAMLVAQGARKIACLGGKPLAAVMGLNFGNPTKKEVFWQFQKSIAGLNYACEVLKTTVLSSDVSFFNNDGNQPIPPTPVVGMIGLVENIKRAPAGEFCGQESLIIHLGSRKRGLFGSEYLINNFKMINGELPPLDLYLEKILINNLGKLIKKGLIESIQAIGQGGLAITLAKMAIESRIGAVIDAQKITDPANFLFSEAPARYLLCCSKGKWLLLKRFLLAQNLPYEVIGYTGGKVLKFSGLFSLTIKEMEQQWLQAIPQLIEN